MSDPRPEPAPDHVPEVAWQRLDGRMLLVQPVREVVRFAPFVVVAFLAGSSRVGAPWQALGLLVPIAIGLLRYATTRFRIADGRVELRTGLVARHSRTTALARVRTVDLSASPVQRVLGLSTVRIGTGTSEQDQPLELDGLPTPRARALRDELLRVSQVGPGAAGGARPPGSLDSPGGGPGRPSPAAPPVLSLDPTWARYAPLTSTGVVVLAGLLGVGGQLLGDLGPDAPFADGTARLGATSPVWVSLAVVAAVALVATAVFAVLGYLSANWGFTLSRADGRWRLRRGLFTTRETTIEEERLAGVRLHEPLSLRLAGAARLSAVVTGLPAGEQGSSLLVPPAPRVVVDATAAAVLGSEETIHGALQGHGPAAARRRYVRALVPAATVVLLVVLAVGPGPLPASVLVAALLLVPVAAALAWDRTRSLGHAHLAGHVVARAGSVVRRREVLADRHVIGWNLRATYFQRRVGLSTVAATTAGGPQSVSVLDVPEGDAVALAHAVLPDVVGQFLLPAPGARPGDRPVDEPARPGRRRR